MADTKATTDDSNNSVIEKARPNPKYLVPGMTSYPLDLANLINTTETCYVKFNINVTSAAKLLKDAKNAVAGTKDKPDDFANPSPTDFDRTKANFQARPLTYRIDQFIFMPMPMEVRIGDAIEYNDNAPVGVVGDIVTAISSGNIAGGASSLLARALGVAKEGNKGAAKAGSPIAKIVEQSTTDASRLVRTAINTKKEALFSDVKKRNFTFTYSCAPKSKEEADTLINIIKTFRYHAYPELIGGSNGGFYIFPSEFDITYMQGSAVNDSLPRISTCILKNVSVNYTPTQGWINMKNGFPPLIEFSMEFSELETLDKNRIDAGF